MKTIKHFFAFCIFISYTLYSFGQNSEIKKNKYNQLYFGLNYGGLVSFSNIKEKDYIPTSGELKFGGGAIIGYQVSPILAFQGQFIYGDVSGKKTKWLNNAPANLKYNTNLMELGFNATVSLSKWWAPRLKINKKLDFYGLLGFGIVGFRSRLYTLDQGLFVNASGYSNNGNTEGDRTIEAVFPLGLGVKYKISEKWNIGIETNLRSVNSDKFDAFERQYNPKDKYSYTFVGIQYIFGKNQKSLEWVDIIEYEKTKDQTPDSSLLHKISFLERELAILKSRDIDYNIASRTAPMEDRIKDLEHKMYKNTNQIDSVTKSKRAEFKTVLPSIYFQFDSYKIAKSNIPKIANAALYLKANPTARLILLAHTDKSGNLNANLKIANNRAEEVMNILLNDYNIDKSRIDIQIKVNTEPLSNNNNSINRRVDFFIVK